MTINKKLRSGNLKVDNYIEELENELLKKETSSIDRFIRASNKVAAVFAKDMEFLAEGLVEECVLLKPDNQDKTVERIMLMLKNNELFSQIAATADKLLPEVINEAQDLKVNLKDEKNTFEQMQERIANGKR